MLCLQQGKYKSLEHCLWYLPRCHRYTIFILFLLCLQNNSHEKHLDCNHYSLCWGMWQLPRLDFLKDLVTFRAALQTNTSLGYIQASVDAVFLHGSETPLSHLISMLPASQLLQQETSMGQESEGKEGWGGTMKLTWPFHSSLPLGGHSKAGRNLNVAFHYLDLVHVGKESSKNRLENVLENSVSGQWSQRMCVLAAHTWCSFAVAAEQLVELNNVGNSPACPSPLGDVVLTSLSLSVTKLIPC